MTRTFLARHAGRRSAAVATAMLTGMTLGGVAAINAIPARAAGVAGGAPASLACAAATSVTPSTAAPPDPCLQAFLRSIDAANATLRGCLATSVAGFEPPDPCIAVWFQSVSSAVSTYFPPNPT